MTKWACERGDWVQKLIRHPPLKDDVIVALLKMARQLRNHLLKNATVITLSRNQGNGILWFWRVREEAKGPGGKIRGQ